MKRFINHDTDPPEGWAETTLGEVVSPSKEKVEPEERPDGAYLSLEHIERETGQIIGCGKGADVNSTKAVFHAGDVLYGKLRPYLNKVCIPGFDGICSTDILVFPTTGHLESRYLMRFLMQHAVVEYAHHHSAGVQLPRVSFGKLAELEFSLPPLVEQGRIVAKVEELLGRVNAARQRLAKVPALLKRFRQSILAAACSGGLTADWRTRQSATISVETMRSAIAKERRQRWIADEIARFERAGRDRPKQLEDRYETPAGPDEKDLQPLPDGWLWVRAEQACDFITKGTTPPSVTMTGGSGDIPYIKVYNLTDRGCLDFSKNPTYIDRTTHTHGALARSKVLPGDVLMNLVGPPLGKVSIVPDSYPEWNTNQAVAIYRPISRLLNSYLALVLLTEDVLGWAVQRSKATVGQHNLTLELAAIFPFRFRR